MAITNKRIIVTGNAVEGLVVDPVGEAAYFMLTK